MSEAERQRLGIPRLDRHGEYVRLVVTFSDGTPVPMPPAWDEQEWCDGGTCEHPECLADRAGEP